MSARKASTSTLIFSGWLALLIGAALITLLIWLGLRGLHHPVGYLTIGAFVAAALLLVRYALFGRSS